MIDFFGTNLVHAQPIEQDGFVFTIDMRTLCGITPERGEELAKEIGAKWDLKQQATDCTCPNCTTKRAADGGDQPQHGSTGLDFINSLSLELTSPNEVLYVGLCIGKLVGKDEARIQRLEALSGLFGQLFQQSTGE